MFLRFDHKMRFSLSAQVSKLIRNMTVVLFEESSSSAFPLNDKFHQEGVSPWTVALPLWSPMYFADLQ